MLRVLRMGLGWAVLWAAIGATVSIVAGAIDPPTIDPGEGPLDLARILGAVGAGTGVVFSLILAVAERGRDVADVSFARAVIWGILAGAALPLLTSINDSVLVNTCPFGALSAALSIALARRARRSRMASPA